MNRFLAAIILLAGSALHAAAQPNKPLGKQKFAEGKTTYAAGDYLGAAQHFAAAYAADPDPAYIFNVGQAYRRRAEASSGSVARDCQRSLFAYKKFLDQVANAPNKAEVEAYVKEMTTCAGKLAQEPSPWVAPVDKPPIDKPPVDKPPIDKPPVDKPPVDKPPVDKPPVDKPPVDKRPIDDGKIVVPPIEQPDELGLTGRQKIGLGVGGVGAVVGGLGIYFLVRTIRTNSEKEEIEKAAGTMPTPGQLRQLSDLNDKGEELNHRAWATGLIGAGLVIGGGVLYLFGGSSTKEQKITVAPSPQGAMVFGSFRF